MYVYICKYVCMYACMCVHMLHVCMYISMNAWKYIYAIVYVGRHIACCKYTSHNHPSSNYGFQYAGIVH